jgi:NTP pyrophosphatase (non-canonical NTP hydrolase)
MDLDLNQLRLKNRRRQNLWLGNQHIDLAFRGLEFAGEVGEAMNLVKKLVRAERGILGNQTLQARDLREQLGEELGDCQITLDLLAQQAGLDLAGCTFLKFNATSRKHGLDVFLEED